MAYTQEHLDGLREALASGALKVRYEGKEVEYRSTAEIRSLIAEIEAALGQSTGSRVTYPKFSRGLTP